MNRFIGGISILLLSALAATAATASENRLEYQLSLTHHAGRSMGQPIDNTPKLSMMQTQEQTAQAGLQATTTQNLSERDRLIYERQHQVVVPVQ